MEQNSDISKYLSRSAAIILAESDSDFRFLESSLVKTLDYLSSRFSVRNSYDYFTEPHNDRDSEILFKVRNGFEEIMWVYLKHTANVSYLSVEVDPEKVKKVRHQLIGFDDTVSRKKYPGLKLIYRDYNQIEHSLKIVCDCFAGNVNVDTNSINFPLRPKNTIRKADGTIRLVCGRCEKTFIKAPRCPECGQLVKE